MGLPEIGSWSRGRDWQLNDRPHRLIDKIVASGGRTLMNLKTWCLEPCARRWRPTSSHNKATRRYLLIR